MWGQWDSCVGDCVCVCVCVSLCTVYVCGCIHCCWERGGGKTRMDQWKDGRTEDNTQRDNGQKNERDTKMSHISIWDRRRDLFKLLWILFPFLMLVFNVSSPPLWMLNDPCTKYSPHVRVLVWAVFLSETRTRPRRLSLSSFASALLSLIPCSLACLFCLVSPPYRAIGLDNQLVVLATTATDAGRYHVEAVNEMTGENVTSAAVYLSISGTEQSFHSSERFGRKPTDALISVCSRSIGLFHRRLSHN